MCIRDRQKGRDCMEVHGSSDAVNAWKQEVLNSRGKDAEHTLKCCLDIERYAKEHKDAALLGFCLLYTSRRKDI